MGIQILHPPPYIMETKTRHNIEAFVKNEWEFLGVSFFGMSNEEASKKFYKKCDEYHFWPGKYRLIKHIYRGIPVPLTEREVPEDWDKYPNQ